MGHFAFLFSSRRHFVWALAATGVLGLLVVCAAGIVFRQPAQEDVSPDRTGGGKRTIGRCEDSERQMDTLFTKGERFPSSPVYESSSCVRADGRRAPVCPNGREEVPRVRHGPTGARMSGDSPYPVVSESVRDWASKKTVDELLSLATGKASPPVHDQEELEKLNEKLDKMSRDEVAAFLKTNPWLVCPKPGDLDNYQPWQSEDTIKASWALALKLSSDSQLYTGIEAALLSGSLPVHVATTLVEIVGLMTDQQATSLLLRLANMHRPPVPFAVLIAALAGRTGAQERKPLEEYVAELDYIQPSQRGEMPQMWVSRDTPPEPDTMQALLTMLRNPVVICDTDARAAMFECLSFLVSDCKKLDRQYADAIREQVASLAVSGSQLTVRAEALELLGTFPATQDGWRPMLDVLRTSHDPDTRLKAVTGLCRYANVPEVAGALLEIGRNDPDRSVRTSAVFVLPRQGPAVEEKALLSWELYSHSDAEADREQALSLLENCGLAAIPYLERIAAQDPVEKFRERSLRSISEIKAKADKADTRGNRAPDVSPDGQ